MITLVCTRAADQANGPPRLHSAEELTSGRIDPGQHEMLWIDVMEPTKEDLALLERLFGFHPLALEDAARRKQRPKIDEYSGYYFAVLYAAEADSERHYLVTHELQFFIGPTFLVTLHDVPLTSIDELAHRLHEGTLGPIIGKDKRAMTVADIVYRIVDAMVDEYFVVIDALAEWGERVEERMFGGRSSRDVLRDLLVLKKTLFIARKAIAPSRDVMNVLLRRNMALFPDDYYPYFQDVYDHTVRVIDGIDTYRDMLAAVLDTNLSLTSNEVAQTVKTMTAVTAILMADALVAGIYGMNFDYMPELHWPLGYLWALGLMLGVSLSLFALFRRVRWL